MNHAGLQFLSTDFPCKKQYEIFIGGKWVKPVGTEYFDCYHTYAAHAAFWGYKPSGIGRENHKKMRDHYQQTKILLVSYSDKALGFF
jgi:acyl-CoA reductase-like NAD-dependent aldehyde dehydrogenase